MHPARLGLYQRVVFNFQFCCISFDRNIIRASCARRSVNNGIVHVSASSHTRTQQMCYLYKLCSLLMAWVCVFVCVCVCVCVCFLGPLTSPPLWSRLCIIEPIYFYLRPSENHRCRSCRLPCVCDPSPSMKYYYKHCQSSISISAESHSLRLIYSPNL